MEREDSRSSSGVVRVARRLCCRAQHVHDILQEGSSTGVRGVEHRGQGGRAPGSEGSSSHTIGAIGGGRRDIYTRVVVRQSSAVACVVASGPVRVSLVYSTYRTLHAHYANHCRSGPRHGKNGVTGMVRGTRPG